MAYSTLLSISRTLLLMPLVALLCACASAPTPSDTRNVGGAVSAVVVAQNFFEDFDKALKDPQIADRSVRKRWVDTLADYFAPSERDEQHEAIATMLENYTVELKNEVAPGEQFQIELRWDDFRQSEVRGSRTMVKVVNGRIHWQVLRDGYLIDEQETPLGQIIGRTDNTVPTLQVGSAWYLTENYE